MFEEWFLFDRSPEAQLRAEHAFRTTVINRVAEGLCVCREIADFPYVEFTMWNDRMTELTGYTMEEINRRGWYQTMYPDPETSAKAAARMATMRQGHDIRGEEWEITRADGQKRVFSISTSVIGSDAGQAYVLALMHDVTERKQAAAILEKHRQVLEETVRERTAELETASQTQRANEALLRAMVENIPVEFWIRDQHGRCTMESAVVRARWGSMLGKRLEDADVPAETLAIWQDNNRRAMAGEIVKGEVRYRAGAEERVYYSILAPIRVDQEIFGSLGFNIDITERKRAEENLAYRHRLLEAIGRAQSRFITSADSRDLFDELLADLLALSQSEYGFIGEVLYTSAGQPYLKTHALTNFAWDEATRAFYERHAPQGLEFHNLKTLYGAVLTSGERVIANDPAADARRGGLPEGHPPLNAFLGVPIRVGGELVAMIGVANRPGGYEPGVLATLEPLLATIGQLVAARRGDAERQKAQAQLQASEERFRVVFQGSRDGILLADMATKEFRFGNEAICRMLGYTMAELQTLRVEDIHPPADLPFVVSQFEKQVRGEITLAQDTPVRRKDGSVFYADINSFPLTIAGTAYLVGFFRDVSERRRTETALRQSQRSLAGAQALAHVGDWQWDASTNAVVWSDELYRIYGFEPGEIVPDYGLVLESIHPASKEEFLQAVEATMNGERTLDMDYRFYRKDGSEAVIHTVGQVQRDASGRPVGLVGVVQDITERKQAEIALRESEEKYRSLIETTDTGYVIVDDQGRVMDANQEYARLAGRTRREDVIGRNVLDWTAPHDHARNAAEVNKCARQGSVRNLEIDYITPAGQIIPIEVNATVLRASGRLQILALCRDISSRKQAEAALKQFKFMVEEADEEVYLANPDGSFAYVNKTAASSLGYTVEELMRLGMPGIDPHYGPEYAAAYEQTKAGHLPLVETLHITKDGRHLNKEIKTSVLQIGGRDFIVGFGRDVTQRKQAEEALEQSKQRFRNLAEENARLLEQARRDAETKATLLQEVNHRVKNNLASIIGLLRAQQRFGRGKEPSAVPAIVRDLAKRIEGLAVVHQMLSSANWSSLRLSVLAGEITRFSLQSVPADKRVLIHVHSSPITVTADQAGSLAFVLNELAANTVKHALKDRATACITVGMTVDNGNIRLTFQDDGPGYPEAALQFEHQSAGMYLVENIVRNSMRGALKLSNSHGAVAEITFKHLPCENLGDQNES